MENIIAASTIRDDSKESDKTFPIERFACNVYH